MNHKINKSKEKKHKYKILIHFQCLRNKNFASIRSFSILPFFIMFEKEKCKKIYFSLVVYLF